LLLDDKGIRAVSSGDRSICPECGEKIVAKCGEIRVWHWAHLKTGECHYGEGKGEWHIKWQDWFFNQGCAIEKKINQNRDDVVLPNGVVIELQESPISNKEIEKRESAYEKMIWLFNIEVIKGKPRFSNERLSWDNKERPMKTTKQGVILQSGYGNPMYEIIYWNDGVLHGRYVQIYNEDLMQIIPYKIENLMLVEIECVDKDQEDRNDVYSLYAKGYITLSKLQELLGVIHKRIKNRQENTLYGKYFERIKDCEKFRQGKCADCFTVIGYCIYNSKITQVMLKSLYSNKTNKPGDSQAPVPTAFKYRR
jgi:hypothetical protein